MISGIPIIATKSGGLVEYLSKYGILIDREDLVENIKKTIRYLYENYDEIKKTTQSALEYAKQYSQESYYSSVAGFIDYMERDDRDEQ